MVIRVIRHLDSMNVIKPLAKLCVDGRVPGHIRPRVGIHRLDGMSINHRRESEDRPIEMADPQERAASAFMRQSSLLTGKIFDTFAKVCM